MHVLNVRPHLDPAASFPSHSFGFDFWFEWQRLRLACGLASSHYCTIVIFEFLCSSPWFNLTIRWPNRKKELELRVRWSNNTRRLGGAFPAGQKRSTSSRRARAALNLLAKWKKMCFFFVKINHFFLSLATIACDVAQRMSEFHFCFKIFFFFFTLFFSLGGLGTTAAHRLFHFIFLFHLCMALLHLFILYASHCCVCIQ